MQHAHNPVDWYAWGDEALKKAKQENKPILVSIGYAACHWCHVMERESFENEATAAVMNEHFVNIKIDREERPDLDHIYMDAVQAMTGSGGWPLNVFLTPDAKPFYGGTYFPPVRAYNRASWTETLKAVSDAFLNKRDDINTQAESLTAHLLQSNSFGLQSPDHANEITPASVADAVSNLLKTADREWGGFGKAPKFPQSFSIQFLLRFHYAKNIQKNSPLHFEAGSSDEDDAALKQAMLSLDRMLEGGIYDQAGGGFARYATDTEWLVPHFEKMLYDNALLVSVLAEAYQLTGLGKYKNAIDETLSFVQDELMHPRNGFYAALDADSEGEEGKFYVWKKREVEDLLGDNANAGLFCDYYDITEKGNWLEGPATAGRNILRIKKPIEIFANDHNMDVAQLQAILDEGKSRLLAARNKRPRPLLDDKVILGWNALMNTACSKAYAATGNEAYRQLAIKNMRFLLDSLAGDMYEFHHTWKDGRARFPAFLDDYAFLIQALIHLQEITSDTSWLERAKQLAEKVISDFGEPGTSFFFYTPAGQADVIVRKKELYDSAVTSGNSVMASNLYTLSIYFDRPEWRNRAIAQVKSLKNAIKKYPASFGWWNCLALEIVSGTVEIAILGPENLDEIRGELLRSYLPNRAMMMSSVENEDFALLAQKKLNSGPAIYVCKNFVCTAPVGSVSAVLSLINRA